MSDRTAQILRMSLLVALITWGGYSLLAYLGQQVHIQVLLSDAQRQAIVEACPSGGTMCMGTQALFYTVTHTLARLSSFLAYGLIGLAAFGALLAMEFMRSGEWTVRLRLSGWKVIAAFAAMVWVLFTTLSFGTTNGTDPYGRIYEPTPQIYSGAGPEALQALTENYDTLKERGCLHYVGQTQSGAGAYDVGAGCMQASFFTRVLPQMLFIAFLLFDLLILGRLLLSLLRCKPAGGVLETVCSLGMGACGLIAILWLAAVLGIYVQWVGWLILLAIPAVGWQHALHWIRASREEWTTESAWGLSIFLGGLLLSYLALNFLNVVRPFPIGWDDLGRYINQPRLLVSYGRFIPTLASFQWEYITSLGFLLFGYDSLFGPTAAMLINWMAGALAVLTLYAGGRTFLGKDRGLLAALFYYALPMVGHFSFADMKVDNAVFAISSLCLLAIFCHAFPQHDEEGDHETLHAHGTGWIILAGLFGGVAFSLKPTSIMAILAGLTVLGGLHLGWAGFVGAFFLGWGIYALQGQLNITTVLGRIGVAEPPIDQATMTFGFLFLAGVFLAYGVLQYKKHALPLARSAGIFAGIVAVSILPWLLYNNWSYGNVVPRLAFTAANTISPTFSMAGEEVVDFGQPIRSLPADLRIDRQNAACKSTSKAEELDRYWGYRTDWTHYGTLPWRAMMNIDSVGYYVTLLPALLLFPLLLLIPLAWEKRGRWVLLLAGSTAFILLQWMIFANGIIWYGLGMFLGLCLGMELLVARAGTPLNRVVAGTLVGYSLLIGFGMRMWQFEQQNDLLKYAFGVESADAMRERVIPDYDDIRDSAMERFETLKDTPYTYRVGTFIPYFIPKNLEVLPVADHQLDQFNCLYQERDAALTLRRLKALGFNGLIFDTNTATIEKDPAGSLHKKVDNLIAFLNDPSIGLRVVVNNPDSGIVYVLFP